MNRQAQELIRYGINGLAATTVHFSVLTFNLQVLALASAGWANLIAALFGIATSFLGSKYFVFPKTDENVIAQALKFSGFYAAIACLHGLILLVWTDRMGYDYRLGFLLAVSLQISLSYMINKFVVFKI